MNILTANKNRRVLVIDDNREIHDDFRKILCPASATAAALDVTETVVWGPRTHTFEQEAPFEVDSAYQGHEGVLMVGKALEAGRPYALAFVDARTPPGFDGVETTRKIWEIDPDVQIVICTAFSDHSWDETFEKLGQPDGLLILKKPFDAVEAFQLGHALMEKWWLHQQTRRETEELERRVAERTKELTKSDALNRAVLNSVTSNIAVVDKHGTIIAVNEGWERFAQENGCDPHSLKAGVGANYLEVCEKAARDLGAEAQEISNGIRGLLTHSQEMFRHEYACHSPTEERWFAMQVSHLNRADGGAVIAHFNITERKKTASKLLVALGRAEASAAAKSESLAIMSHELRTPLNGVLGWAQLLAETPLVSAQREYAKMISKSGEHLLAIVGDILDFSSIEAGTLGIHVAPLAVADLVKESEDTVRKIAAEKGIEVRYELAAGVPAQITGDEQRLRQILINLLGNAVKFTASGSVVLRVARSGQGSRPCEAPVSAAMPASKQAGRPFSLEEEGIEPTAPGGSFLDFSVEDTGIGISSETLSHLFQPFVQVDSSKTRNFGGTGLGLAISKRLAEAMGGAITVASNPEKGSTFTFRFPLEPAPVCALGMAALPPPVSEGNKPVLTEHRPPVQTGATLITHSEGGIVLVVEDDRGSRMLAGKMVESIGLRAELAADGEEAALAFVPGKYFAILMDMSMPVTGGLEATKKIREIEAAAGCHVPIIALTANEMPCDRQEQCFAAGMDDFLTKPLKRAELDTILASVAQIS